MKLRLAHLAYPVTALGPGRRLALWVAGCPLSCRGCITPNLWNPDAGREVAVDKVLKRISALDVALDGITLSGGEPFVQATALTQLLEGLATLRPNWNVLIFSGYPHATLTKRGRDATDLLARTDVLVAGVFDQQRPAVHPLAGSANQTVHYLSARGQTLRPIIESTPFNQFDIGLGSDDQQFLIGVIDTTKRQSLHQALGNDHTAKEPLK